MTESAATGTVKEYPWWIAAWDSVKYWLLRQRRKLPYLVWWNDELDVVVTLTRDKLPEISVPASGELGPDVLRPLFSGAFYEAEKILGEMDIHFDRGMGEHGRDWEWDWSLEGPISVRFKGRATRPERRGERPRPQLVVSNPRSAA